MREVQAQTPEIDVLRENCGVFAVIDASAPGTLGEQTYQAMLRLQGRGEDGAGLYLFDPEDRRFIGEKGTGLVKETIFDGGGLLDARVPRARVAIGHVRYGTFGKAEDREDCVQPFLGHQGRPYAVAHNGHLEWIGEVMERYGLPKERTVNDSECFTQLVGHIRDLKALDQNESDPMFAGLKELIPQLEGAASVVVAQEDAVYAACDQWGFRPLFMGRRLPGADDPADKGAVMFSSEEPAIWAAGGEVVREVKRGEIIRADKNGEIISHQTDVSGAPNARCLLEYVYLMRKQGSWDGRSIAESRIAMGYELALSLKGKVDVVFGVPDSGTTMAIGLAEALCVPFREGFVRDGYAGGRSFILRPELRKVAVQRKLSVVKAHVQGKRVVIGDDSMIRGNTMETIVGMLRNAGAAEVHVVISSPPITDPCVYGIDIGDPNTLIARKHMRPDGTVDTEAIAKELNVDSVTYLGVEGLKRAVRPAIGSAVCTACMTGEYPTRTPARASTFVGIPRMRAPVSSQVSLDPA